MICKRCNTPMVKVMSFEQGKNFEFYKCRKCNQESRHIPISFTTELAQGKKHKKVRVKNKTEQVRKGA